MAKAFLSHSSKEKPLVERIATQLGRNNCHLDSLTFEAGRQTLEEIFKGLENTDIFVLFISENSLESDWVKGEISQAKNLLDRQIIDRIFPLIIDSRISYRDTRIPDWIRKPYNIRILDNEVLILKKIKQFLRESNFKKYSHLKEQSELFIGRHELIQEFERKLINIENTKPTCIIASSYFEGIGRRTFVKNGLVKTGIIDKWYDPVSVPISSKESIEDFIYKLNFVRATSDIFVHDFAKESLEKKVQLAINCIKTFVENNEVIFIIDDGSIVLPNHTIVDWFLQIISDSNLQNQVNVVLISKFKPYGPLVKRMTNIISFQVNELSIPDTQTFFIQYLRLAGQALKPEETKFFLKYLKGIPGQIIYAASLIDSVGVQEAKRYVHDIEEFDELRALSIFEFLKDDELSKQMLIALSKFEIISYDLVYRIFGESNDVYRSIQKLFDLALFYSVSSTHEYLKLNTSISDYINRSRIDLNIKNSERIKEITREAIQKRITLDEYSDYSEFLFTLQAMIRQNISIPSKFLIPSFILKSMVQEYYSRHYKTVIELASKLLETYDRFDPQIIRETRYWLCLAYCRTKSEKIFDALKYFKDDNEENLKDYHFLLGFYYRNCDKMEEAERNFLSVLKIDSNHSRTKRELVNVYLRKGEYMMALDWARDNYSRFRTNILHIQAYFTCLIKKHHLIDSDYETINELLEGASKSYDKKARDIHSEMVAEYDYYIEGNSDSAIHTLEESLKLNPNNYFAFRALIEIYKRNNMLREIEDIILKYPDLSEPEYE